MAEAASPNSFNFFQAMINPQFAASQLQIQRQQALAQQLMDQGSEQPPTAQLANPGGLVVPNSPVAALARALEKGAGGYMQGKALADQMQSYKDLYNTQHPILPQAQNAVLQGQDGPPTTEQMEMARQLSDQIRMQSLSKGAPQPMYMDPAFMQNAGTVGVDNATKEYIDRTKPTDQMKNANSGNPLVTNPMVKEGLIPGGQDYLNLPPSNAPQGNPATPPQASTGQQPNVMPNPIAGTTPGYNPNSSVSIAGAKKSAEEMATEQVGAFKNQQETQSKTNLMLQNSQALVDTANQLLKDHPVVANSTYLLNKAKGVQEKIPGAGKDIDTGITKLNQLSAGNLLPSIKQFLQGTGQVRVFEGVNLDKIFSYEPDISLQANIQKWQTGIKQIQMGQQGADNLRAAFQTGKIQGADQQIPPSAPPVQNTQPSQSNGLNWVRQNGRLVQQ